MWTWPGGSGPLNPSSLSSIYTATINSSNSSNAVTAGRRTPWRPFDPNALLVSILPPCVWNKYASAITSSTRDAIEPSSSSTRRLSSPMAVTSLSTAPLPVISKPPSSHGDRTHPVAREPAPIPIGPLSSEPNVTYAYRDDTRELQLQRQHSRDDGNGVDSHPTNHNSGSGNGSGNNNHTHPFVDHHHLIRAVAGSVAGAAAAVATFPLDLVKTRLQVQIPGTHDVVYKGVVGTLRTTARQEGYRGWFKGLGSTLLGIVPNWAIYFSTYGFFQERLTALWSSDQPHTHTQHHALSESQKFYVNLFSAIGAGCITTMATNPLFVVKLRLQTQRVGRERYDGIVHAFQRIYKEETFRGFYKGLPASLLGVSHVAVQFPLYEWLKDEFAAANATEADEAASLLQSASRGPGAETVLNRTARAMESPLSVSVSNGSSGLHLRQSVVVSVEDRPCGIL